MLPRESLDESAAIGIPQRPQDQGFEFGPVEPSWRFDIGTDFRMFLERAVGFNVVFGGVPNLFRRTIGRHQSDAPIGIFLFTKQIELILQINGDALFTVVGGIQQFAPSRVTLLQRWPIVFALSQKYQRRVVGIVEILCRRVATPAHGFPTGVLTRALVFDADRRLPNDSGNEQRVDQSRQETVDRRHTLLGPVRGFFARLRES